jgi:4-amino-4-deoxy-L-arabinose transferase-like glycosyltransferase
LTRTPPRGSVEPTFGGRARSLAEGAALCVVLGGALALRLWGVRRGLPYLHEWDEPLVMTWVVGMLQRGDINPSTFAYPSVYYYLLLPVVHVWYWYLHLRGALASPWAVQLFHPQGDYARYWWYISDPSVYLWGRILTACFGAATVYVVFRLGAVLFEPAVGLLAAAILAVSPGTIYYADTVRVDVPMLFFLLLSMLAGVAIWRRGDRRAYSRAGLLAGLAISTKPNAFWLAVPLLVAHLFNTTRDAIVDRRVVRLGLFTLLGFVIGTPFALAQVGYFLRRMGQNAAVYGGFPTLAMLRVGMPMYLRYLVRPAQGDEWYVIPHVAMGLAPVVAALLGAVAGFLWKPKEQLYLMSFAVVYFVYTAGQRFLPLRYIMPVLPFIALFAAVGAVWLWRRAGSLRVLASPSARGALAAAGIVLLLFGPTRDSIALARALAQDRDTRALAVDWLRAHVPPGATVAFESELRWFIPDVNRLPFVVVYSSQGDDAAWYRAHRVAFAVVDARSGLRSQDVVFRAPSPSYLPSYDDVAAWPADTFMLVDPSLLIVRNPG